MKYGFRQESRISRNFLGIESATYVVKSDAESRFADKADSFALPPQNPKQENVMNTVRFAPVLFLPHLLSKAVN